ncbi:MAG: [FeFe] hydrogenase H-cluster radical SAM maturase HydG, partial [Bacteroidia bacterium]
MRPFIDADEIWDIINNTSSDRSRVREVIKKALEKKRLTLEETAVLVNTTSEDLIEEIKAGARELKKMI